MALSGLQILNRLAATLTSSNPDGTSYSATPQFNISDLPSDASIVFHNKYTIAGGANQSLDLYGTLVDGFGNTVNFAKIYAIAVSNRNTNTGNNIEVGNSNFSAWLGTATDKVKVGPKGSLVLSSPVDGYTVTNTTGDTFKINNPGASAIDVVVFLLGK